MNWKKFKSFLFRYGSAVLFVCVALLITNLVWALIVKPVGSPLFLGAIMLSAWLFGTRPGIFATIVAGFAIDYYLVTPFYEFTGSREEVLRLLLFVGEGTLLSWLISSRKIASEKIKSSQEQLLALSLHQQTMREAEQKRIALEIHDELGQALTGLKMDIHWLNRQISEAEGKVSKEMVSEKLGGILKMTDTTISSVRRIATELRPPVLDDFGLIAALEWQAREFERKTGVTCLFESDVEELNLNTESSTAVFRIFQETLTNITRHANASAVKVNFETLTDQIVMRVEDDGKGIDFDEIKNRKSLGLLGMNERARLIGGEIKIFNGVEGGTTVELKMSPALIA